MSIRAPIDARLDAWPDLAPRFRGSGVLVGNGASRAVWDRFDYRSLLEVAQGAQLRNPLGMVGRRVFDALRTANFEAVLHALDTTSTVNAALGLDAEAPSDAYRQIRYALIEAVRWIHPPWKQVTQPVRRGIREALLPYDWVYSTNYDLLVYWAIMDEDGGEGFTDYFWNSSCEFDPSNTEVWSARTRVLFLHGGLHLHTGPHGERKRVAPPGSNLLDSFLAAQDGAGWLPLFVTEGDSRGKRRAIANSEYLSFAYRRLVEHEGPLVVFGQSLGEQDTHLVNALNERGERELAIGILAQSDDHVIGEKGRLKGRLPKHRLSFFDAFTHPLGNERLRIGRMTHAVSAG